MRTLKFNIGDYTEQAAGLTESRTFPTTATAVFIPGTQTLSVHFHTPNLPVESETHRADVMGDGRSWTDTTVREAMNAMWYILSEIPTFNR